MMFLIRAGFWLAVVSVFVPRDFAGESFDLPINIAETRIDAGKPVNVCGELAGRPLEACVLAALGYRSLSMAAGSIGPVKQALAGCDLSLLTPWLDAEILQGATIGPASLRDRMLRAGKEIGLPREVVDKN